VESENSRDDYRGREYNGEYGAAIIVADIVGFSTSGLVFESGVDTAFYNLGWMLQKTRLSGFALKSTGDGYMGCFPSRRQAIGAVYAIKQELEKGIAESFSRMQRNSPGNDFVIAGQVLTRIGVSYGNVHVTWTPYRRLFEARGYCITEAARLESFAQPGEILFSPSFCDDPFVKQSCILNPVTRIAKKSYNHHGIEVRVGDEIPCYKFAGVEKFADIPYVD
jgi:class 3 adenylate cyclase